MRREKLIALRGNRSQEQVAKELGITRQMLSYIELGKRTPSLNLAKRIADYYGVSVEELLFDQNSNETLHKNATA